MSTDQLLRPGDEIDRFRLLEELPALPGELAVPLFRGEALSTGDPVVIALLIPSTKNVVQPAGGDRVAGFGQRAWSASTTELDAFYDRCLRFAQLDAPRSRSERWPAPRPLPLLASASSASGSSPAFVCWQWEPGQTLRARLRLHYPDIAGALKIVLGAAYGLAPLHAAGELHGGLCPANLLVGSDDQTRLLAPGVARLVLPTNAESTSDAKAADDPGAAGADDSGAAGADGYRGPEQLPGGKGPIGPASDVFALGVLLYELVACERPFRADNVADLLTLMESSPPPHLSGDPKLYPGELHALIQQALEPDPRRRPRSAGALIEPLIRLLETLEPSAVPVLTPAAQAIPRAKTDPQTVSTPTPAPQSGAQSGSRPGAPWSHPALRLRGSGKPSSFERVPIKAKDRDRWLEGVGLLHLWIVPGLFLVLFLLLAIWWWAR